MGISLVDADLPGDLDAITKQLTEAVSGNDEQDDTEQQQGAQRRAEARADAIEDGDDVPAKLRGKSRAEVIEYYKNLESAYGRQANDLGTQRQMTDRLLGLKRESDLATHTPPSRVEVKTQDVLDNPTEAIERVLQARLSKIEADNAQRLAEQEAAIARDKFMAKHADYEVTANDPEFVAWLQKSSYRLRAAHQARNGDWTAADDLLSEFKSLKPSTGREQVKNDNVEAARKAGLESGTSSESASKKGGKIYRRVDLMRLRTEKPDLYYDDAFQQEILKAYADKRVR